MKPKFRRLSCVLFLAALCIPATDFGNMRHRASFRRARSPQRVDQRKGQSATLLPDGNWLLVGGIGADGQPVTDGFIRNGQSGAIVQLGTHLQFARAWHAATVLPNGQVLIHGGTGSQGQIVTAVELFDPVKQTFSMIQGTGLTPRSHHTATVLTNGMVLLAGGVGADGSPIRELEEWSFQSGVAQVVPVLLKHPREDHTAYLLADGTVLLWGGNNSSEGTLKYGEVFDPGTDTTQTETNPPPSATNTDSPMMEISNPESGDDQVSVNVFVAIRFSKPLLVSSINAQTMQLAGPEGQLAGTVIPAEQGMLAFLIPSQTLTSGTNYQVALDGITDANGLALPAQEFSFETAGGDNGAGTAAPVVPIPIGTGTIGTDGRGGIPTPPAMPPLQAPAGVTAVSGRVLQLNGIPLSGVLLQVDNQKTYSDATGRFLVKDVTAGHRVLVMDGEPANQRGVFYGIYQAGVDVVAGQTNVLAYTIWMTEIDKKNEITIPSPTPAETVVSTPAIPGLELHLPANAVLKDLSGNVVTKLGITSIPVKQPPFPLPIGVKVPIYFTIQPGGAYLDSGAESGQWSNGAQLYYPNLHHAPPGTAFDFWNYDPTGKGWYRYGIGKVSQDGKQIVPEPDVEIYEFTGAMVASPSFAPSIGPHPGDPNGGGGDPVDLQTGLFVYNKSDLVVSDVIPIGLSRTYRQNDWQSRSFGIGTSNSYDMFLTSNTTCGVFAQPGCYQDAEVVLPDGSQVQYLRTSPGYSWTDAVFQTTTSPTAFYGSQITWNGNGWNLKMKDGTIYQFPDGEDATNSQQAALTAIIDRNGNKLNITRFSSGTLSYISTPNNRWMQFTSDSSGRITGATDNIGRSVGYVYDTNGNLIQFTDANGGVTNYTYGASSQMTAIQDPKGITYLTNVFDANQRVIRQIQADGSNFQFAYITDPNTGQVIETDVIDPLGHVRKVSFNSNGYTQTDTRASGLPEQQTTSYFWDLSSNLLQSALDPANNLTDYTHDAAGNVTAVTRMAGTAAQATTSFVYEPVFNQLVTITDPLQHTASFFYDTRGNLVATEDPLGNRVTITYNAAGQVLTITDATQSATIQMAYDDGDLASVTNPLNATTSFFNDGVGRLVAMTDPMGGITRYSLDALNQITAVTDPRGDSTQFASDPNGKVVSVTDARGQTTSFAYNIMGRRMSRTDPLGGVETYQYDAAGNLIGLTDRRGKNTTFAFDGLNRATFVGYGTQAGPTYESTVTVSYDSLNRLTQTVDSIVGTTSRQFDDVQRTMTESSPNGVVTYSFDAAGRRIAMTAGSQNKTNYMYDNADHLTQIVQGTSTVQMTYDSDNRRQTVTLPDGVIVTYGYDLASKITGMSYAIGTTSLGNLTYLYDSNGRRVNVGGSLAQTLLPLSVTGATYNANNQLTAWGASNLFYDADGNMTSDGTHAYSWDARNRLLQIDLGTTASFGYDALWRRVTRTVLGTNTTFLYDALNIVQEITGANTANSLVAGVDEIFARSDSGGTASFLPDALGSTLALADSGGALQTTYSYEPFGTTAVSGAGTTNSFAYNGRQLDATGLYYYRARYYDTQIQRFISEDPTGFDGGTNTFLYAGNSPANANDPMGLWSPPAHDKILEHALSGCATPADIKRIQAASRDFDSRTGGPVQFSPLHSMRAPDQSAQQALAIRDAYVQQTLSQATAAEQDGIHGQAMDLLGEAVHPTMDSTSPIHVDSNGDPLPWNNLKSVDDYFHSPGDYWGDETSSSLPFGYARFNSMENQIKSNYMGVMGGCTAGRKTGKP